MHAQTPVKTLAPALLQNAFPRLEISSRARDAILVVAGSLLIAGLAQIQIPLPFTPIPLTLQTLGVFLVGATLGRNRGLLSVALYLAEGSLGLPFFAGGLGGIAHLLSPRGGYLVGFVLAAGLIGALAERGWDRTPLRATAALALGQLVIYALGVGWLAQFIGFQPALIAGFLPFLVGDALKIAVAASTLPFAWSALGRAKK